MANRSLSHSLSYMIHERSNLTSYSVLIIFSDNMYVIHDNGGNVIFPTGNDGVILVDNQYVIFT
jgi:hypothetical protein